MNSMLSEKILHHLQGIKTALNVFDLCEQINKSVELVQPELNALTAQGRLCITRKGKYMPPQAMGLVSAKASALRNGTPTAVLSDNGAVLKVRYTDRTRCMPDDIILVRIINDDECELVAIASRGKQEIPAFIRAEVREIRRLLPKRDRKRMHKTAEIEKKTVYTAVPCDRRIPCSISLTPSDVQLKNNEIALVAIDAYPEGEKPIVGHAVRIIGSKSDMRARLQVIAENHGFSSESSMEVLDQARTFSDDLAQEIPHREDLRNLLLFTIDGPFSKDFDDAVSLERTGDAWSLGVHIADVSHYVRQGSPIDRNALERGTSLYLPGVTVPMLPEILSNNLCSLMPNQDRLALSLFMTLRNGCVVDHRLCTSVIHSKARLTYDQVNRFYDGDSDAVPENLHAVLRDMLSLSHSIRTNRTRKGCIDLDLPESEFILNEENVPTDICIEDRGESERLIEDFMLVANETVAMLARTTETPIVYRIHDKPDADRLESLKTYLAGIGIQTHLGHSPHPGEIQALLESTKDHPGADSIRRMVLRSMQRAHYSEKPEGHYALALEDYCHFTSPIRRYPDLIVHRMLKQMLEGNIASVSEKRMSELARQSSEREYEATLAEREASDLMKARYMQDRIGRKFPGTITGVTAWGLYVTLENSVEGLVHIASLDDYYEFDREHNQLVSVGSGNVFRLGDRVRVRVEYADLDRGEIDFSLVPFTKTRI